MPLTDEEKEERKRARMLDLFRSKPYNAALQMAAKTLQELVRVEAADENGIVDCRACGKVAKWNQQMEGSHYIPRHYTATMLSEDNVYACCTYCNNYLAGNIGALATKLGPAIVADLEARKGHRKYTLDELVDMRLGWQRRIKIAKKRFS
jgi:hypothetical protein